LVFDWAVLLPNQKPRNLNPISRCLRMFRK
jgi:hypothetical protein